MDEYAVTVQKWLEQVAEGCDRISNDPELEMDMDYEPLQSDIYLSPRLMIIGSNPPLNPDKTQQEGVGSRQKKDAATLRYGSNQLLKHLKEHNRYPLNSLSKLFTGEILRPVFEKAVITHLIYFTSHDPFLKMKKYRGFHKSLDFCLQKNLELIQIIQPQTILLMGSPVRDIFNPYLDLPLEGVLMINQGKTQLIGHSFYQDIPVYWIHHPSSIVEKQFNFGIYQVAKRKYFEQVFQPK